VESGEPAGLADRCAAATVDYLSNTKGIDINRLQLGTAASTATKLSCGSCLPAPVSKTPRCSAEAPPDAEHQRRRRTRLVLISSPDTELGRTEPTY
jgi:hypothetical protein